MIRLWNRVGIFRSMSVTVLVCGLVGGLLLANREAQHDDLVSTTAVAAGPGVDDVHQTTAQDAADQKDAQDKANEMAAMDGERAKAAEDQARKNQAATRSDNRTTKPGVNAGPVPSSCSSYSGNKAIGCTLMLKAGYGLDQMPCLDKLWTKESHWNEKAGNKSTGAYGIPQAVPGSKMAVFGSDWQTNPATQIAWGLSYIKGRYKTPCGAWSKSQSSGWY